LGVHSGFLVLLKGSDDLSTPIVRTEGQQRELDTSDFDKSVSIVHDLLISTGILLKAGKADLK